MFEKIEKELNLILGIQYEHIAEYNKLGLLVADDYSLLLLDMNLGAELDKMLEIDSNMELVDGTVGNIHLLTLTESDQWKEQLKNGD